MAVQPKRRMVTVFRSRRREGMYLYTDHAEGLQALPAGLVEHFGKADKVMTLMLHPERPLARANAADVLLAIDEKGFYLQLPPPLEADMRAVAEARELQPAMARRQRSEDGDCALA